MFCTDASPEAGGICEADVSEDLTRAVHRLADRRGFRTQLLQRATAKLVGGGWLSQPELDDENDDSWLDDAGGVTEIQLQSRYGDMEQRAMALCKAHGG